MMKTIEQLKEHFIRLAEPIIEEYVGAALGTRELKSTNASCRTEVWDLLKQLMLKASDVIPQNPKISGLSLNSTKDIMRAVKDGHLNVEQGKQLVSMYKVIAESEAIGAVSGTKANLPVLNITLRDADGEREIKRS